MGRMGRRAITGRRAELVNRRTAGVPRRRRSRGEVAGVVARPRTRTSLRREDGRHADREERRNERAGSRPIVRRRVVQRLAVARQDDSVRAVDGATQPRPRHRGRDRQEIDEERKGRPRPGKGGRARAAA